MSVIYTKSALQKFLTCVDFPKMITKLFDASLIMVSKYHKLPVTFVLVILWISRHFYAHGSRTVILENTNQKTGTQKMNEILFHLNENELLKTTSNSTTLFRRMIHGDQNLYPLDFLKIFEANLPQNVITKKKNWMPEYLLPLDEKSMKMQWVPIMVCVCSEWNEIIIQFVRMICNTNKKSNRN